VTALWAIATREYRSFFRVPVGWVVVALYLFLAGVIFAERILIPGEPSTLRYFFGISGFLLLPVVPAISMRLFSEELKSGTIEPLMTSPVGDLAIVAGKYLGGALFLGAMLAPTILYPITLLLVSDPKPDPGPILAGYLSLILLGLLYLAVGTLASSLTSNQTLAFLGTFLFLLLTLLVTSDLVTLPPMIARWAGVISLGPKLADFAKGVIDTSHIVFFLAGSGWFLVLAYISLQTRRWR
jgi:ABC-2 type transport system permease protein